MAGTILTVSFGAPASSCTSVDVIESYWTENAAVWWTYLALSLSVASAALITHTVYSRPRLEPLPHAHIVLPVTFTLSSALFGGARECRSPYPSPHAPIGRL